jgi:NNP family nitrate/nitrite transporter-like MFS transporter
MAGAFGNVGAVTYLFILTQVDYKTFFYILSIGAGISVLACYFLLKEPENSFGTDEESEEDAEKMQTEIA